MPRLARVLLVALVAMPLVAGVALAKRSVDFDQEADFTKYKTFTLSDEDPLPNPLAEKRLKNILREVMLAEGLEEVAEGGDLVVFSHGSNEKKQQVYVDNYGYGRWRYGWGTTTATVSEFDVGTLVIDLVDNETDQLVWRGVATETISSKPEKNEKRFRSAIGKLFKKYPPKQKKKK